MSGRNRVVAYHSLSSRPKLKSWTFLLADVTWSNSPVIVTFGAGACARTGGASIATVTKAKTAMTRNFLITASSVVVSSHLIGPCHFHRHHQQLQGTLRTAGKFVSQGEVRGQVKTAIPRVLAPVAKIFELRRRRLAEGGIRPSFRASRKTALASAF